MEPRFNWRRSTCPSSRLRPSDEKGVRSVVLLAGLERSILGRGERNLQGTRRCRLHRPWRAITQPVTDGWATNHSERRLAIAAKHDNRVSGVAVVVCVHRELALRPL